MERYYKHFVTITKHKWYVMIACFKCGLYLQGILHDLSKYSFIEFFTSARYFQGDKSPIEAEKIKKGYSLAWQNHKAKNKHHWHYWVDIEKGKVIALEMPAKYLAEMLCDWIGASKAYNKGPWTLDVLKTWYQKQTMVLNDATKGYIEKVMKNAKTEQELYDNYISIKNIKRHYDIVKFEAY